MSCEENSEHETETTTNGTSSLIEEEQTLHPFTQLQAKDYYNIQFFDGNHNNNNNNNIIIIIIIIISKGFLKQLTIKTKVKIHHVSTALRSLSSKMLRI